MDGCTVRRMSFSQIKPFVRYARYMLLNQNSNFPAFIPVDSRLFFVIDGVGEIIADGESYTMNKDDVLILKSGIEYRLCPSESQATYLILNYDYTYDSSGKVVPLPPKQKEIFKPQDLVENIDFLDAEELNRVLYLPSVVEIKERLIKIEREYLNKFLFYENKVSGILGDVIIHCLRRSRGGNATEGHHQIEMILNYIHENYNEKLTNISLAEHFGFHPNYMSQIVKNYTGMPLHKYIIYVKLSHAIDLLNSSELTVGEISERCGFCDIYYFSRYFKQYTGMSPMQYRSRNAGI